jgi:hypothetical protein
MKCGFLPTVSGDDSENAKAYVGEIGMMRSCGSEVRMTDKTN